MRAFLLELHDFIENLDNLIFVRLIFCLFIIKNEASYNMRYFKVILPGEEHKRWLGILGE